MSDSQRNPWTLCLMNNVKDNVVFLAWKVFSSDFSFLVFLQLDCAGNFCREPTQSKIISFKIIKFLMDQTKLFLMDQTKLFLMDQIKLFLMDQTKLFIILVNQTYHCKNEGSLENTFMDPFQICLNSLKRSCWQWCLNM